MILGKKQKTTSNQLIHVEKGAEDRRKNEEDMFDLNIMTSI